MGIESGAAEYSSTEGALQVYFQSASTVFRFVMQARRQAIHFSNTVCLEGCQPHSKVLRCLQVSGQIQSEGELGGGDPRSAGDNSFAAPVHSQPHDGLSRFSHCPKQGNLMI